MKKHIHLTDCDSTQDILKEQLNNQTTPAQFLISCENQHQGRGRGEKVWETMPGTICFSFNLRAHPELSYTALEISVLIARFFEAKGRNIKLKWPNDLWDENNKKCGGILVQSSHNTLMAGIGLNLFSADPLHGGIYESSFEIDKRIWARDITDFILHHRYKEVDTLRDNWLKRCGHLNTKVTVTEGNETYTGIFLGLGIHGECEIQTGNTVSRIFNGTLRIS